MWGNNWKPMCLTPKRILKSAFRAWVCNETHLHTSCPTLFGVVMEQHVMEFCTPEMGHHSLSTLDIPKIRERCIEACLEAFVEERQFKYTDAYIIGVKK